MGVWVRVYIFFSFSVFGLVMRKMKKPNIIPFFLFLLSECKRKKENHFFIFLFLVLHKKNKKGVALQLYFVLHKKNEKRCGAAVVFQIVMVVSGCGRGVCVGEERAGWGMYGKWWWWGGRVGCRGGLG